VTGISPKGETRPGTVVCSLGIPPGLRSLYLIDTVPASQIGRRVCSPPPGAGFGWCDVEERGKEGQERDLSPAPRILRKSLGCGPPCSLAPSSHSLRKGSIVPAGHFPGDFSARRLPSRGDRGITLSFPFPAPPVRPFFGFRFGVSFENTERARGRRT